MFVEASFDEEADQGFDGETRTPATGGTSRAAGASGPSPVPGGAVATCTMHFHKPGEDGFCAVAGAGDDITALLDARTVSGDSWVSADCHCTRCECLRVMQKIEAVEHSLSHSQASRLRPIVLLMLDMDNFGFNQFKSVPPGTTAAMDNEDTYAQGTDPMDVQPLCHLFVWAFFGSCFTRYHSTWPTEESVCLPPAARSSTAMTTAAAQSKSNAPSRPPRPSIWQRLVRMGRVHFTPCAGQSQAADSVMLTVMGVFADRRVIILTGDSLLLREIRSRRRLRGRKSRRDNEDDMMGDRLTLIDANDHDKRFVPVWRELMMSVEQMVLSARAEDAEAAKAVR